MSFASGVFPSADRDRFNLNKSSNLAIEYGSGSREVHMLSFKIKTVGASLGSHETAKEEQSAATRKCSTATEQA